jgi:hypothetical protein
MQAVAGRRWADSPERQRVLQAVLVGDDQQIDVALEELLTRMSSEAVMLHRMAVSSRNTRRLEAAPRFELWASAEPSERTEASRTEARKLNGVLRNWFSKVTLAMDARGVVIVAHNRSASNTGDSPGRAEARFDRRDWIRWSPVARRTHRDLHRMGGLGDPWGATSLGRRSWARPAVRGLVSGRVLFPDILNGTTALQQLEGRVDTRWASARCPQRTGSRCG